MSAVATALVVALVIGGLTCQVSAVAMEQAVEIEVGKVTLHGSLLSPDLMPSKACALIIAGSGPTDRDGNSRLLPGKNNSLRYLAESLQSLSIESLRYDKRKVGESIVDDQNESDLRFSHYVQDASFLLEWLDRRCDVPVFILGHSEGGHIGLTVAQQRPLAGLVILAGPGTHPADLIANQLAQQISGDLLERSEQVLRELRQGQLVASPPQELAALFRPSVQPYLISWFKHDPLAQIAGLSVPVLLVYGTADLQVPPADGEALKLANPNAELQVISGMNHLLKSVPGTMAEQMASYSDPSLPLAIELPPILAKFLLGKK
ncbi:MAG: alpha/beta hydrolase [Lysobacterales bacterium]